MGDIEEVFLNNEEFAEDGTYHFKSGATKIISGIFDRDYLSVDPDTGAEVQSRNPKFAVASRDINEVPTPDDYIIIRGVNYRIIEVHPDGTGITDLILQHNRHD